MAARTQVDRYENKDFQVALALDVISRSGATPVANPWLAISYGLPGSGKTACVSVFKRRLHVDALVQANVDTVVESIPQYRDEVAHIMSLLIGPSLGSDELLDRLTSLYNKYRGVASSINDVVIQMSLTKKLNVLVEKTGGTAGTVHWFVAYLLPIARALGYRVALLYPVVQRGTALARSEARAARTGRRPHPTFIVETFDLAKKNFAILAQECDLIVVYNNDLRTDSEAKRDKEGVHPAAAAACSEEIVHCERAKGGTRCEWNASWSPERLLDVNLAVPV